MSDYRGPERRENTCTQHGEIASIRGKLNLLLLVFGALISLVAYNIHSTQQIQVFVAEQIAKIEGQINAVNVRAKSADDVVHDNRVIIQDHETRLRYLENRLER